MDTRIGRDRHMLRRRQLLAKLHIYTGDMDTLSAEAATQ